ncbi:Uncharacterised protein [Mycobacteroides abscessus subsp. abscessus]|nr:Uncharacterised protein [Mycobacteroides abscessus subsp. abscessus]
MERPTGLPQFQQNLLDSSTTGLVIKASSGSISGTRGISTSPPPSRRVGDSSTRVVVARTSGWVVGCVAGCVESGGRNTARVEMGRIVEAESTSRSARDAGWVPGPSSADVSSGSSGSSLISPDTLRLEVRARVPAHSATCGTRRSTCHHAGCVPGFD